MDASEILRQMQQDPALKAQMRTYLLGEELLVLPELVKENSKQIAENATQIANLVERMERVEAQIANLVERMERVEAQIANLNRDVGDLKGSQLEEDVRNHPRAYIRRSHMTALRTLSDDERYDLSGSLKPAEQDELDEVDAILLGRRVDGTEAYVAVEASATIDNSDLTTVLRRAKLLAIATGKPVLPVAICKQDPDDRLIRRATTLKVAIARKQGGLRVEAPYITPVG